MTIGYYTDNQVSQRVMQAFSSGGARTAHIENFDPYNIDNPFFYGILRGTGVAMRHLQFLGESYRYLDNGYFDALYMDEHKRKDMNGKYRIVKNDMIEPIYIDPEKIVTGSPRVLMLPPSGYTAFMYDTIPEDWNIYWSKKLSENKSEVGIRSKDTDFPLEEQLKEFDAVLAFNSIGVMKAIEMGKAVYTTHGVIRNQHMIGKFVPYYDLKKLKDFYEPKQFTLEEIADRGVRCLQ